jgi:hypothetical protein
MFVCMCDLSVQFITSHAWVWGNLSLLLHLAMWPSLLRLWRGTVASSFFAHQEDGAFFFEYNFNGLR